MRMRLLCRAGLALGLLASAPAAAKDFRPGDLRPCSDSGCAPIVDKSLVTALSRFVYRGPQPAETRAPRIGWSYFQLQFGSGSLIGVAATRQLDRFRSRGVNLSRFNDEDWYRIPPRVAAGLRRLAAGLQPLRVTESTIAPRRYG
jgi:hypothetical protein